MSKTIKDKIRTALRITLGVCFILSGVMKAVNVYSFAQENFTGTQVFTSGQPRQSKKRWSVSAPR